MIIAQYLNMSQYTPEIGSILTVRLMDRSKRTGLWTENGLVLQSNVAGIPIPADRIHSWKVYIDEGEGERPLVAIESPLSPSDGLSATYQRNVEYAQQCLLDSLMRHEAPFASHLLYPQVLNDADPASRALGMAAGLEWHRVIDSVVVYEDLGVSSGMQASIDRAELHGVPVVRRKINEDSGSEMAGRIQ